ncbi:serine-threonine protein kinase, putative [Bodo saltans]|uniref:Serine-threonine protein kinase, putative n=1 Tax=Bodo saltans TaxID=75058 RepID=A0A0S4ITD7_BODSA|nr:serine-threonine protein kinase, putative [Bodo saltans]|eukprot:CUG06485.1 serine-threonine protein kinase, putative [Bodo saltans]
MLTSGAPPAMVFTIDRIAMGSRVGGEGSTQVRQCSLTPVGTAVPALGTNVPLIAMKRLSKEQAVACARPELFDLEHTNINKIIGWVPGDEVLLLQLSENGSLSIEAFKKLPVNEKLLQAVACCLQVAEGLAYLRDRGMVHRGVKPANVLRYGDTFKLCDFGTSKKVQDKGCNDLDTFAYAAPELYPEMNHQHDEASAESDSYSLGCLLLELGTNCLVWGTDDVRAIRAAIGEGRSPVALQHLWPSWCPQELSKLAGKLVSFDPSNRGEIKAAIGSLKDTMNVLEALKANSMKLFNAPSPYGPNWLQDIDELRSLALAIARLAGMKPPTNRPDLERHASSIATPHDLDDLQAKLHIHSITCEHRRIIALFTAESPICYMLNGTMSQLKCPDSDRDRIAPVAKRLYKAVQQLGRPFKGTAFRALYADAPHLQEAHTTYETLLVGSSLNSFQFSSFTTNLSSIQHFTGCGRPMILLRCENLIGFDIDDLSYLALTSHPLENEVLVLPPAYFTVKTKPFKVNNIVVVDLEYRVSESQKGCYSLEPNNFFLDRARECGAAANGDEGQTCLDCFAQLQEADSRNVGMFEAPHPFIAAAASGEVNILRELVAAEYTSSDPIDATQRVRAQVWTAAPDGQTPLYAAASNGHSDMIRALRNTWPDVPVIVNNGLSPLHAAAQGGHAAAVIALLEKRPDNVSHERNGETSSYRVEVKRTPRLCANVFLQLLNVLHELSLQPQASASSSRVSEPTIKSLRSGILCAMQDGVTPLCVAASQGHAAVIDALILNDTPFETSEVVLSLIAATIGNHADAITSLTPLVSNSAWSRAPLLAATILNSNRSIIDQLRSLRGSAVLGQ